MSTNALMSSGLATLAAETLTFPLCTLNTRYLAGSDRTRTIPQVYRAMRQEGVRSFYRGLSWAAASQALSTATKFALTDQLYSQLRCAGYLKPPSPTDGFDVTTMRLLMLGLTPCVAGALSTVITHPLDWFKIAWQRSTQSKPELRCNIYQTVRRQPSIIYRGWSKSALKSGVGGTLWFGMYFTLREQFAYSAVTASVMTGITAPILGGFLNTLKVQRTAGIASNDASTSSISSITLKIRTIYRGNSINFCRVFPHFVVTMTLTDLLRTRGDVTPLSLSLFLSPE
jgi:hypothetical protein